MTYDEWISEGYLADDLKSGLRTGQSYIVRVRPEWNNPGLFFETDTHRCWVMIDEAETNWQGY